MFAFENFVPACFDAARWPVSAKKLVALLATGALCTPALATTWTVKGRIKVNHQLDELDDLRGDIAGLEGVNIKVSARYKVLGVWGWWTSWGTDLTDSDGDFLISESPAVSPNADRQIKVQIQFKNDDLKLISDGCDIDPAADSEWFTVYNADTEHSPGVIDLGTRTFKSDGQFDMNDWQARRMADIWVVLSLMIEEFESYGPDYGFGGQLKLQYPADGCLPLGPIAASNSSSWADPVTEVAHVIEDHFNVTSIVHEAFHIWQYRHSTGENSLIGTLMAEGTTHCHVDDSDTAFYEGGACFMEDKILEVVFGQEQALPYNRAHLNDGINSEIDACSGDRINTLDELEHHSAGWAHAFRIFTLHNIANYDFLTADAVTTEDYVIPPGRFGLLYDTPEIDLKQFLKVHLANAGAGYPNVIDDSEMNIRDFLTRAADVLAKFDGDDADAYESLMDPAEEAEGPDFYDPDSDFGGGLNPTWP